MAQVPDAACAPSSRILRICSYKHLDPVSLHCSADLALQNDQEIHARNHGDLIGTQRILITDYEAVDVQLFAVAAKPKYPYARRGTGGSARMCSICSILLVGSRPYRPGLALSTDNQPVGVEAPPAALTCAPLMEHGAAANLEVIYIQKLLQQCKQSMSASMHHRSAYVHHTPRPHATAQLPTIKQEPADGAFDEHTSPPLPYASTSASTSAAPNTDWWCLPESCDGGARRAAVEAGRSAVQAQDKQEPAATCAKASESEAGAARGPVQTQAAGRAAVQAQGKGEVEASRAKDMKKDLAEYRHQLDTHAGKTSCYNPESNSEKSKADAHSHFQETSCASGTLDQKTTRLLREDIHACGIFKMDWTTMEAAHGYNGVTPGKMRCAAYYPTFPKYF
jgi:hypothetical protein